MSEFRRDPLTLRWVLTGFRTGEKLENLIPSLQKAKDCPFCVNQEHRTPPEISRLNLEKSPHPWDLRIIPNYGTEMKLEEPLRRPEGGIYDLQNASGLNETIVDSPEHITSFSELKPEQIALILEAISTRLKYYQSNPLLRSALVFRNQGAGGPQIYDHSHTQMVAFPFLVKSLVDQIKGSKKYYSIKQRCLFCDIAIEELKNSARKIDQVGDFVAWCPFASRFPFELWITSKTHYPHFMQLDSAARKDLAALLKKVKMRLEKLMGDRAITMVLHTAPFRMETKKELYETEQFYHWHIEILPQAMPPGGFEWGADLYLSPPSPELCAEILKKVDIE